MDAAQIILIVFIAFSLGAIAAFLIRKMVFEKQYVPAAVHAGVCQELTVLRTEKEFKDAELQQLKCEKDSLCEIRDNLTADLNNLSTELGGCKADRNNADKLVYETKSLLEIVRQSKTEVDAALVSREKELIEVNAQLKEYKEKLDTQKQDIENLGGKFEDAFKVLAQNILEDKSRKFSEEQNKNLKGILEPLQKEIQLFKEDVGAKQKQESDERISLREQVKGMTTLNQTLSEQANKLTETLRLQVKQQGDWGESILEAILENSGLQKDLQYFTQQSSRNAEGKIIRPDVLIKYPDQRTIIIDSKVSLVHYYNMCSSHGEEDQKRSLQLLIQSLRSHIDGLASKNYGDISQALDFIIMFVPVEPAYIAAMHADPELWQYAYKKGILLISPANLIATLKLVKDMWRKDAVDKNAQEIADKAGKLYDKLVIFVETFEKVGVQLDKAGETWSDAKKQLTAGKGNLISQALKMNALHINSKKDLPDDIANQAILNDHFDPEGKKNDFLLYE
jgi:DNA recombination protein RmuC